MLSSIILAYAGLFVWSFLAATILPLSSEVALIALVRTEQQIGAPVVIATIGNYLGACTTYWLTRHAARRFGSTQPKQPSRERAAALLRRYGPPALLLSWVPLLGDGLVILAGALAVPFKSFSLWVAIGKVARYLAVAWLAASL